MQKAKGSWKPPIQDHSSPIKKDTKHTSSPMNNDTKPAADEKTQIALVLYHEILKNELILLPKVFAFDSRLACFDLYLDLECLDYRFAIKYSLDRRQWKFVLHDLLQEVRCNQEWKNYLEKVKLKYLNQIEKLKYLIKKPVWASSLCHCGDIARYQAMYLKDSSKWTEAKKYYQEACLLSPKVGLYWNQLGLISRSLNLYLDASRFYFKACCALKPFKAAPDALVELMFFIANTFQVGDSTASMVLLDIQEASIRLCEYQLHKLISQLYTKVDLDQFKKNLETFLLSLGRAEPHLNHLPEEQQLYWWTCIAINVFGNFYMVTQFKDYHESAKQEIQEQSTNLLFGILEFMFEGMKQKESYKLFFALSLSWIATEPTPFCFHTVRSYSD
jgi:hypothetical protein